VPLDRGAAWSLAASSLTGRDGQADDLRARPTEGRPADGGRLLGLGLGYFYAGDGALAAAED
jgi:hypothetical protein